MAPQNENTEFYSGYIRIDENLCVLEVSGHVNQILRIEQIDQHENLLHIVDKLKKNIRAFLKAEVLPIVSAREIRHFSFDRQDTQVSIAVTPIASGITIISFEEIFKSAQNEEDPLPEKLKEFFIRISPDLKITYVSKNGFSKLGRKKAELIGAHLDEIEFFSDQTSTVTQLINQAFQYQKQNEKDIRISQEKKPVWWNITAIPETETTNRQQSVLLILRNVNRYKKTEERLIESEYRYQLATEAAELGIWDYTVETGKTFYSRKWKAMLGYYTDEIAEEFTVLEEMLHPEDRDRIMRLFKNFLKSDLYVFEADFRLRHKNGNYVWIRNQASVQRDESGKAIRMFGTHRDISEEKKSESEFKKLHQAILQSPISVIITDTEGYIEFFNPAFCKITGWGDHEIIGKKTNILKSGFHTNSFYEKLWETISSGNEWQGELKNKKKTGEFYWELASISPIRNNFGNITHYVKISENITYLKKIEKDLKKAKQDAEIANNYKNHFLANMSHEIRTPINTIIGFSELLKNEELNMQKRNKYSEIIEENSQALLRLIDDIIDVSKIEANELKIKKEACSLGELFSELEMTYNNYLKKKQNKNLRLIFHIPEEAHHDVIFTDPYRLKQILNNLYLNALKYTETGNIEIGYNIINDNKIRFFVSDTGAGILPERIKTIFKRFNYSEESNTTSSGLGLSICKDLAILLGGDINVKSIPREGSVFYLTIPYDKIKIPLVRSTMRPTPRAKYNFNNYTIMVAEDTPYNYEYLHSILQKTGANVIWAKDGIDVLNLYNSSKVDLILMDIQLPEISGYEATSQIRKKDTNIPIIAQTAFAMPEEKDKCLKSGCNEVLVKPIMMDDVLTTVAKYLNK